MKLLLVIPATLFVLVSRFLSAQTGPTPTTPHFSRADTLRGMLTPLRTCYDVRYYHLDVRVDPAAESIAGSMGPPRGSLKILPGAGSRSEAV